MKVQDLIDLGYDCAIAFENEDLTAWNISGYGLSVVVDGSNKEMLTSLIDNHEGRKEAFEEDPIERMIEIMKSMPTTIE